jgi:hypothetical protein
MRYPSSGNPARGGNSKEYVMAAQRRGRYARRGDLRIYNKVIRSIASDSVAHLGIDTMRSRVAMARWCRRLRKEYPFRDQFPASSQRPLEGSRRAYG